MLNARDDRTVHYQNIELGSDLGQSIDYLKRPGKERLIVNSCF